MREKQKSVPLALSSVCQIHFIVYSTPSGEKQLLQTLNSPTRITPFNYVIFLVNPLQVPTPRPMHQQLGQIHCSSKTGFIFGAEYYFKKVQK